MLCLSILTGLRVIIAKAWIVSAGVFVSPGSACTAVVAAFRKLLSTVCDGNSLEIKNKRFIRGRYGRRSKCGMCNGSFQVALRLSGSSSLRY